MKKAKPKFNDIRDGFDFVSAVPPMDHEAFLCRETGVVSLHSESTAEEAPIPHKNELGLG